MDKKKSIIISVSIVIIIAVVGIFFIALSSKSKNAGVFEFSYSDDHIPPSEFQIRVNYDSKELYVHEEHSCSAVDCSENKSDNTIKLTDEEMEKISKITEDDFDRSYLTDALSSLAHDSEVMAKKDDSSWDDMYKDADQDGDGVVTNREFGNMYLDILLAEKSQD